MQQLDLVVGGLQCDASEAMDRHLDPLLRGSM